MRTICIRAFGGPEQLRMEDAPVPRPGPSEIVAKVQAVGVNPVDWKIREGRFHRQAASFPLAMGQDFAGSVTEVAPDVTAFAPGDRIFGFASGAYAEFVKAAENEVVRTPRVLSDEAAAGIPTPGVTAYQIIHRAVHLNARQSILIHGAAGAVGSIAVQLALIAGAVVTATVTSAADADYLKELGVQMAINNRRERFEDHVGKLDAVVDLVGGEVQQRSYALLKPGGVLVTSVGTLDDSQARLRDVRAIRFMMSRSGADLAKLAKLIEHGELRLRIANVLAFEQARQAQDLTEHGGVHGKVILRVA